MRIDAVATVAGTSAPKARMEMSDATVKLMDITSDMLSALRAGADDGQATQRNGKRAGRMNDLIKREDALKELRLDHKDVIYIDKTECARRIKAIPSADKPSKEGEWEIEEFTSIYGKGYRLTCSECGDVFTATDEALPREHYCRYCGAKNTKRWKGAEDEDN